MRFLTSSRFSSADPEMWEECVCLSTLLLLQSRSEHNCLHLHFLEPLFA